jgi:hypothetical protein
LLDVKHPKQQASQRQRAATEDTAEEKRPYPSFSVQPSPTIFKLHIFHEKILLTVKCT